MAFFGTSLVMILIFVVFMLVISSSTAHKVSDTEIKHLCSKSNNPACCYKILKSDHRTANVDPKGLVEVSVDLASKKAHKIHSQLNSFFKATHDSQLRNLYNLCSKNYNGTIHDLEVVKINQHSGAYKNIHVQVKHASSVMILIFILFMLVTPSTTAHKVTDTEIKHLCSKSSNHVRCYKLINSNHRTANVDANGLVEASVDLASNKANKIHSQLNSFSKATHDSRLRELYNLCSKNYNETIHDIELVKNNLRDLCSQTRNLKDCWKIIKSEYGRFDDADYRNLAGIVIDLAIAKADEIHDKLNRLHEDSRNDELKGKYLSCSKNYNDANRNLDLAKRNVNSNRYRNIPVQINDTLEELRSCRREFNNDSFDPAHIGNRNKEFGNYVDIVKVATDLLLREDDRN